jgi:hypothetical protein
MRISILLAAIMALVLTPFAWADDLPNLNKRGTKGSEDEKKFVTEMTTAIVKAAHHTGKDAKYTKYDFTTPDAKTTMLRIELEYKGAVTGVTYPSEATVDFDTTDKEHWKVRDIKFKDEKNNIPASTEKITELVKSFNAATPPK